MAGQEGIFLCHRRGGNPRLPRWRRRRHARRRGPPSSTLRRRRPYHYGPPIGVAGPTTTALPSASPTTQQQNSASGGVGPNVVRNRKKRAGKKKKSKRKPKSAADGFSNASWFVIETCKHLRERKQYLVWHAVGCLGITAMRELVKEDCGGQMTSDGTRSRSGGGILWNILKAREPEAYKEIMAKGRELEKQLWSKDGKKTSRGGNDSISLDVPPATRDSTIHAEVSRQRAHETKPKVEENGGKKRVSVLSRIREPVVSRMTYLMKLVKTSKHIDIMKVLTVFVSWYLRPSLAI